MVGLLCVRQARAGGVSKLASSPAVHNAMLERRPDLAAALYQPVWRSRLGEELGGEKIAYPLPIFGQRDGRFTSHYSLTYIEAAQLLDGVPRLTAAQREAIDMLMQPREGTVLRDDAGAGRHPAPQQPRDLSRPHAVRGRRRHRPRPPAAAAVAGMPNSRALPEDHAVLWRNVAAGALRGGIGQANSATSAA